MQIGSEALRQLKERPRTFEQSINLVEELCNPPTDEDGEPLWERPTAEQVRKLLEAGHVG